MITTYDLTTLAGRWRSHAAKAMLLAMCFCACHSRAESPMAAAATDTFAVMPQHLLSMPQLMLSMMSAIERIGKYKGPANYPSVRRVTRSELEREACEERRCRFVRAAYVPNKGLYLDNALDPVHNIVDRSILLHELVHHLQSATQRYSHLSPCNRRLVEEQEAYEIQNGYLAQVGSSRFVAFPERMYRCEADAG